MRIFQLGTRYGQVRGVVPKRSLMMAMRDYEDKQTPPAMGGDIGVFQPDVEVKATNHQMANRPYTPSL
jgi:hypothetical protein